MWEDVLFINFFREENKSGLQERVQDWRRRGGENGDQDWSACGLSCGWNEVCSFFLTQFLYQAVCTQRTPKEPKQSYALWTCPDMYLTLPGLKPQPVMSQLCAYSTRPQWLMSLCYLTIVEREHVSSCILIFIMIKLINNWSDQLLIIIVIVFLHQSLAWICNLSSNQVHFRRSNWKPINWPPEAIGWDESHIPEE